MATRIIRADTRYDGPSVVDLSANGLSGKPVEPENTTAAMPEDKMPDCLPPFNIQVALVRANGKPKLLRRMMLRFRILYAGAGPELREMIAVGKFEEAHRFAHSLRGVAATLEAKQLAASAANIEHALNDGRLEGVFELIQTMEGALAPAIDAAVSLEKAIYAIEHAPDLV